MTMAKERTKPVEIPPVEAPTQAATPAEEIADELIACCAYENRQQRGTPLWKDAQDWFTVEQERSVRSEGKPPRAAYIAVDASQSSAAAWRARLIVGVLAIGGLMVACSTNDDGRHEDAGSDASFDAATQGDGSSDLDAADGGTTPDGSQSACVPACASMVCCVDQHGHVPRCVDGTACPAPLKPPDGS
jgi:hypothetical protein